MSHSSMSSRDIKFCASVGEIILVDVVLDNVPEAEEWKQGVHKEAHSMKFVF